MVAIFFPWSSKLAEWLLLESWAVSESSLIWQYNGLNLFNAHKFGCKKLQPGSLWLNHFYKMKLLIHQVIISWSLGLLTKCYLNGIVSISVLVDKWYYNNMQISCKGSVYLVTCTARVFSFFFNRLNVKAFSPPVQCYKTID